MSNMIDAVTIHHVFDMIDDQIREDERKELYQKYGNYPHSSSMNLTGAGHRVITGKAMAIVKRVLDNGGTEDEVHKALVYLFVCMDAMKHKLDYKQCCIDYGIRALDEKYKGARG